MPFISRPDGEMVENLSIQIYEALEVLGFPPFFGRTTIILVGVYHHPKGTTIFFMVATTSGGNLL